MKTINEAAEIEAKLKHGFDMEEEKYYQSNKVNVYDAFKKGVEFANDWIDVNEHLPRKGECVLCTVIKLSWIETPYAIGYLAEDYTKDVWIIEGHHCSHYKNAVNNCVTHWRPIERS